MSNWPLLATLNITIDSIGQLMLLIHAVSVSVH